MWRGTSRSRSVLGGLSPTHFTFGGEWGIRTPEGLHPTRFPSVRHRPLGEFSWPVAELPQPPEIIPVRARRSLRPLTVTRMNCDTPGLGCRSARRVAFHPRLARSRRAAVALTRLLAWRHPGQLPQGGNAARVTGLWRVREGSYFFCQPVLPRLACDALLKPTLDRYRRESRRTRRRLSPSTFGKLVPVR